MTIEVEPVNDTRIGTTIALPEPPRGWFDYSYAVLRDGVLGLLRTEIDIHAFFETLARDEAAGRRRAVPPDLWEGRARVSRFDGSAESEAVELPLVPVPAFARLPDGRWLIAARVAAHGERNCRLYTASAEPVGSIVMGDAIACIQCAADGTIWVGYGGQGVFSRRGEDGTWMPSVAGLAQFATDGTLLWDHNRQACPAPPIGHCYALAIDGDTAWTCSFSRFPIIRIEGGRTRYWLNRVFGALALAVEGDHLALLGSYGSDADRLALLRLGERWAHRRGQLTFAPLPQHGARLLQGQGATLHAVGHGQWTRVTVGDVRAALAR
jgi:hypothetical protein